MTRGEEPNGARPGWFEDDAFWDAASRALFDDEAWSRAEEEAGHLAGLLEIEPGASVLDLGCGPGRYVLPLAELGYRVTGVDRTAAYLAEARARARRGGSRSSWKKRT